MRFSPAAATGRRSVRESSSLLRSPHVPPRLLHARPLTLTAACRRKASRHPSLDMNSRPGLKKHAENLHKGMKETMYPGSFVGPAMVLQMRQLGLISATSGHLQLQLYQLACSSMEAGSSSMTTVQYYWDPPAKANYVLEKGLISALVFEASKRASVGEAYFHLGKLCLEPQRGAEFREIGLYMLEMAAELGSENAVIHLCLRELYSQRQSQSHVDFSAPHSAKRALKQLAQAGHFEAGIVHLAISLHNSPLEALDDRVVALAKDMVEQTEPDPDHSIIWPGGGNDKTSGDMTRLPAPWELLRDIAHTRLKRQPQGNGKYAEEALLAEALRAGALDYSDPGAYLQLARTHSCETYSAAWAEAVAKAAMAGDRTAMEDLGKYYLEKHGWYPSEMEGDGSSSGGPSTQLDAQVGFEWLKIAAALRATRGDLNGAGLMYVMMACVLRENGLAHEAVECVEEGLQMLQDARDSLSPGKAIALGGLQAYFRDFADFAAGQQTKDFPVHAAAFLKAPNVPFTEALAGK